MNRHLALLCFAGLLVFAGRPIALEDYYRVETASAPAISPDGRLVVFVRSTIIEQENKHSTGLWIAPADGSGPASPLMGAMPNATNPRWSPDGKLLAFRVGGNTWFLPMDRAGATAVQIRGVDGAAVFSPDNKWIAFTKKTPPPKKMDERSAFEKQLDQRFKGKAYDWMNVRFDQRGYLPDPRDPQASPPNELYVVAREGGEAKQITHLNVDVSGIAWKPDSSAIAFTADSHQRDEYSYERSDLWIADLEGQARRVTDDGFQYDSPAWSPDGKSLVVRRRQSLNDVIAKRQNHGAKVDLYRVDANGGAGKSLTDAFDLIPDAPVWHGGTIYFGAAVGGDTHLFGVASTGAPLRLTLGDRSLAGFSFSEDFSRMAYVAQDSTHPAEVYSAGVLSGDEKKLTNFNGTLLSDVELAPAERIHFPSKDGTQIEGWMVMPRNAKGPVPMVLAIHGGPHGAYGTHFDFEFQWLAANGYAVLYTNPRGSTGYGEKFLWATWGGWGRLDYQDVMAGVDYAIGHYPIDAKRLGVTGYSYGGFLTDWVITQTNRFVAAVSGAGISNWLSDYGTADIPRTKESEFYGTAWNQEASERMRALSPITHAGNVKTPTLFVHGESDMRVPIEEAEQMYTALKKQRVPAKFIRYPGNYHGGWPPWDMVHRYYNEAQWFRQYLGG
jgi:dipeptidyl aminopeptidase/acylaminoacyl peptidase